MSCSSTTSHGAKSVMRFGWPTSDGPTRHGATVGSPMRRTSLRLTTKSTPHEPTPERIRGALASEQGFEGRRRAHLSRPMPCQRVGQLLKFDYSTQYSDDHLRTQAMSAPIVAVSRSALFLHVARNRSGGTASPTTVRPLAASSRQPARGNPRHQQLREQIVSRTNHRHLAPTNGRGSPENGLKSKRVRPADGPASTRETIPRSTVPTCQVRCEW
jgi:hypothetical protein